MPGSFYDTDRAVAEYLLFHYGTPGQILPCDFGPTDALNYPVRCVTDCLDAQRLTPSARALDLGCAVGRSAFELARHCTEVAGIDYSRRFVEVAAHLQRQGSFTYAYADEGQLGVPATAVVPLEIDRPRVRFEQGDAMDLRPGLGQFDVVLMANLIDRLGDPRRCLAQLPALVNPGGQVILTSPYTWLQEYTPMENWLGGFERDGQPVRTFETLRKILSPAFELAVRKNLPFLIREHARKFQWSVAEATVWIRKRQL